MSGLRVIGFDLDNTLYDQAQHMRSFFREAAGEVAKQCALPVSELEEGFREVWLRRTSYYPKLFDEVLETAGIADKNIVKQLVSLYHQHRAELTLFDGVREMLGRLRGRFSLFMITDGNERMQRGKLESLQLEGLFDEVVLTGRFGKEWAKPSLLPFRRVLDRFGGDPVEYLYVGDNPHCDFYGARQLGMRTARVLTEPFASHALQSEQYGADFSLPKTIDLEQVL